MMHFVFPLFSIITIICVLHKVDQPMKFVTTLHCSMKHKLQEKILGHKSGPLLPKVFDL